MSIFKETLDPEIQTQLQARTLVVNGVNNNRSGLLPWYLSKNAWVRMTSFVNFTEGIVEFDGLGSVKIKDETGHYKGDQLSRKYILEGGTLYTAGRQNQASLRYGVGTPNGVYGSDIDFRPDGTADPNYFRQQGIRPMPGITNVSMRTIGAYGSLFETTVNFHAWDTNQLNELEILFMRPGYSVLLEWGWSQFLNYNDSYINYKDKLSPDSLEAQIFTGQTIDPFNANLTPNDVYDELERLRKKYRYNYDGMLGYVKNFNWKLRRDGGYDCSTTLISMGEVINTLKLNTNANSLNDRLPAEDEENPYIYDDYENILLSLKSLSEYQLTTSSSTFISESAYIGNWDYNVNFVGPEAIKTKLENNGYKKQAEYINSIPVSLQIENTTDTNSGKYYEYLPLDLVVAIISSYTNLKANNKKDTYQYVKILVPDESDYCLAGKDTISVLPNICNIKSTGAFKEELKYFNFPDGYNAAELGVTSEFLIPKNSEWVIPNFYDPSLKAGKLKNILINIDYLLTTYKQLKLSNDDSGVNITDYFKSILNGVSNALGGLNNFILSTAGRNQNILRIIDTYYLEQGRKDDKYQFDLIGLGSICKDVSIQSQIFQEQSTIVAIAAQSKANLGDVYNSTQVYLNAGLEDRLALAKWQGDEDKAKDILNKDDGFYIKLAKLMSYSKRFIVGTKKESDQFRTVSTIDSNGSDPHTLLKQALLRYDGEMNFKALIPFKLRITLEGIGGIVVGQIFTVKQNILPKNYYDKNLGFIVTQIEHNLRDNQWETVLDTQICILDQHNFYDSNGLSKLTKNLKREGFGLYVGRAQASALLYPIFLDFLIYQATRSFIGYIYSSVGPIINTGMGVVNEYLIDSKGNNDDVIEFWKSNVDKFIGKTRPTSRTLYQPRNSNNFVINYPMDSEGFTMFIGDWTETWKLVNPDKVNLPFSEDGTTIGNLLDFISKGDYNNPVANLPYRDFKKYRDDIDEVISKMSPDVFWPSGKESVYEGQDIRTIIDYNILKETVRIGTRGTGIREATDIYYSVKGWKIKNITDNFTKIIKELGGNNMDTIINNYYADTKMSNGSPFNTYFAPNSNVMYGNSKSLIISDETNLRGDVLNSFAFEGFGGKNKSRDTKWAITIDWKGYETESGDINTEENKTDGDFINRENSFFDSKIK